MTFMAQFPECITKLRRYCLALGSSTNANGSTISYGKRINEQNEGRIICTSINLEKD
jgi:hypothetical protein